MEKKTKHTILRAIIMPLIALMLVVSTILPSAAFALESDEIIEVTMSSGVITEEKVNKETQIITLQLEDNEWAQNLNKDLIIESMVADVDSMVADVDSKAWNDYRAKIGPTHISVDSTGKILTITLPQDNIYKISQNQNISFNLSPAVIEKWPGQVQVTPSSFTIYSKPRLTLGGTITNATAGDIRQGGTEIELDLQNAVWDKSEIVEKGKLNVLLDQFKVDDSSQAPWTITQSLKDMDPNKYISFANGDRTLKITLPAFSGYDDTEKIKFSSQNKNLISSFFIIDTDIPTNTPIGDVDDIYIGKLGFEITEGASSVVAYTKLEVINMMESKIRSDSDSDKASIIIEIGGAKWNLPNEDAEKALLDAFVPKTHSAEWEKIKGEITDISVVPDTDNRKVQINLPTVGDFYLTSDQEIAFKVPYQLLDQKVDMKEQSFTIEAQPKVLVTGSATPSISQMDVINGNKTVVLTLVNAKWDTEIAKDSGKRNDLLEGLKGLDDHFSIIKARADVIRNNEKTVTITLPQLTGFKASAEKEVEFKLQDNLAIRDNNQDSFNVGPVKAFTIMPVSNITASASGSMTSKVNEFDIIQGEKELLISLKNDVWVKNVEQKVEKTNESGEKLNKITFENNGSSIALPDYKVTRKSDTVLSLTFDKPINYGELKFEKDVVVSVNIPQALVSISATEVKIDSAFTISAVKAELSGNGVTMDFADIQKGKKKLVVTLKNATFINVDKAKFDDIFEYSSNGKWNDVVKAINEDEKSIKVTKDKVTITLPAVPNYEATAEEIVNLKVKKDVIDHPSSKVVKVDKDIVIGQSGSAEITSGSSITESKLKSAGLSLTIKLQGATWDPAIVTNTSKQATLLKGFKADDQTKEWTLVLNAIKKDVKNFTLNGDSLTIEIPAVPEYAIVRNQVVNVVIPKSVLKDYKYDINAKTITITVPKGVASDKTFRELLSEEIQPEQLHTTRIMVPKKKVETIFINTTELPGQTGGVTTVEITADNTVGKIAVTVKSGENGITKEMSQKVNGKFLFVFSNVEKNSEMKVSVFDGSNTQLQADIYKKIGKGSKTYNELPKKDLTGSYSLYSLLTDKSLLKDILKYYTIDELKVQ